MRDDQVPNRLNQYESTVAQEIREEIMRDSIGCWKKGEFVKNYFDNLELLRPYLLARSRVIGEQ